MYILHPFSSLIGNEIFNLHYAGLRNHKIIYRTGWVEYYMIIKTQNSLYFVMDWVKDNAIMFLNVVFGPLC